SAAHDRLVQKIALTAVVDQADNTAVEGRFYPVATWGRSNRHNVDFASLSSPAGTLFASPRPKRWPPHRAEPEHSSSSWLHAQNLPRKLSRRLRSLWQKALAATRLRIDSA